MGNVNRTCLSRNTVRWVNLTGIIMKIWVRILAVYWTAERLQYFKSGLYNMQYPSNKMHLPVWVSHDSECRLYFPTAFRRGVPIHGVIRVQHIQDESGCPTDDKQHDDSHQHLDYLRRATYQQQKTQLDCTHSTLRLQGEVAFCRLHRFGVNAPHN